MVLVHGYSDHSHWLITESAVKYSQSGISSFAFDHEGHGKSDGLPGFVESFDLLVDDTIQYILYARSVHPGLKLFLHGGSMGGAIVLLVALKRPDLVDRIIVAAPMIKIVDSARPRDVTTDILKAICWFFPALAIVPRVNVIDISYRYEEHREFARNNPFTYKGKIRLGTGLEILRVTDYLQANLTNITTPMLILHGTGDLVTSHESSEALFNKAKSRDKTLKLYAGLWHMLLLEPGFEKIDEDVANWINARIDSDQVCNSKEFACTIGEKEIARAASVYLEQT